MFSRCTTCALALAFLFIPNHVVIADDHAGHDHGGHEAAGEIESCACAALEDDHPFTIDCSNSAAVQSAYDSFLSEDCGALEGEGGVAKCDDMDHYALTCVTYYFIVKVRVVAVAVATTTPCAPCAVRQVRPRARSPPCGTNLARTWCYN